MNSFGTAGSASVLCLNTATHLEVGAASANTAPDVSVVGTGEVSTVLLRSDAFGLYPAVHLHQSVPLEENEQGRSSFSSFHGFCCKAWSQIHPLFSAPSKVEIALAY